MLEELTALNKLHDEVNAEVVLEDILHAHEEGVIVRVENVLLQVDVLDLLVFKHQVLADALHCIEFIVQRVLNDVNLAEGAASDHLLDVEVLQLGTTVVGRVHDCLCVAHHRFLDFVIIITVVVILV